ncbi:periplasmic component of amino acid ABC-type transporter/signal transduction system [Burkholderiales bacterium JOSHI_001]|nr:periplasmic component of amino acid ABC-type transporter/signal transduction system [Burkholderiales bacterium JOSHI_001]
MGAQGSAQARRWSRWWWGAGALAMSALVLQGLKSAGYGTGLGDDGSLRRVQQAGELRVGYSVEAPYAMVLPDGQVSGAFPELTRQLAAHAGLHRITWVQMGFDALIPALQERRIDLVAAGLFVTPAREKLVRFSQPLVAVHPGWLTVVGNPKALGAYGDLKGRLGVKVAVLQGSAEQAVLAELGLPDTQLWPVPDAQAGQAMLLASRVDALALSLPTVRHLAGTLGSCCQALLAAAEGAPTVPASRAALAFHPQDLALARAFDQALQVLQDQPEFRRTVSRFGFDGAKPSAALATR